MSTAMQDAMTAAMPELKDRVPLARQIESAEQVASMAMADLERLFVAHEAECVSLAGRIDAATDDRWIRKARQALRVLHLHRGWVARELARRKRADAAETQRQAQRAAAEAKRAGQRSAADLRAAADEARMKRILASNDVNAQHIAVFKEVAREVLGAEMYAHLWELTRLRLGLTA